MRLVLDSGGVSALAGQRARLVELRRRGLWPPLVPSVVLTEALTGDHRRDFHANRLLGMCQIKSIDEQLARQAAALRTATGIASDISATDAVVVSLGAQLEGASILTSDPGDLRALAAQSESAISITPV